MDKPLYGSMVWVDDEYGMTSIHEVDGHSFQIQGYESTADEFEVRWDNRADSRMHGTPVFYYNHNLEGRMIKVYVQEPEVLVRAVLALADRMDVGWRMAELLPAFSYGRKAILTAEDTLFMEGFLNHDDYPELPSEVADAVAPDGTEGGTLRFYAVPIQDVWEAEIKLEASGA